MRPKTTPRLQKILRARSTQSLRLTADASSSEEGPVDVRVLRDHLSVDDLLPRVHGPREAAGHAGERQGHVDHDLLLRVSRAAQVVASSPADPAGGVEERQRRRDDASTNELAGGDGAGVAVLLAAKALAVRLLSPDEARLLLQQAVVDGSVLGVLLQL